MVQGDAYSIEVEITNEGQTLSPPAVFLVEIALLNLVKTYPGDVTFSDGKFHFPLTQPETFGLPTVCPMRVRVKFPRRHGDLRSAAVQAHLRRGRLLRQDDDLRHPRGRRGEARGAEQVSRAGTIPRSILRKERQRL